MPNSLCINVLFTIDFIKFYDIILNVKFIEKTKGNVFMKENNGRIAGRGKAIIIASVMISVVIILIAVLATIFNKNSVASTSSEIKNSYDQEDKTNVEESTNLENTEIQENVNEDELKKINEEEIKKAEEEAKKNGQNVNTKSKYFIRVNIQSQVINVYTYDKNGKYTVPVKAFVCSTGSQTPSSGTYTMASSGGSKRRVWPLYGGVYGQYVTPIVGDILFHSVPYLEKKGNDVVHDSLKYWEYDKLGTKASMGCIRLTTRDAKWIYDNVSLWTKVEFYSSSNPGPFGKPSAQKISNAPGNLKNWDPTDPASNNPWKTYKPGQEHDKDNEQNKENNEEKNNIKNETVENNTVKNEVVTNNVIENNIVSGNNEAINNTEGSNVINDAIENNIINNSVNNTERNIDKSVKEVE